MKKVNILLCIGTRPEGIKLAPVIKALEVQKDRFEYTICSTGQHREMLGQVLDFFEYKTDYNMDLMTDDQSLSSFSSKLLAKVDGLLENTKPDIILTQGDTTTAFLITLSAFYKKIKSGHVEAGLRTYDRFNPFPEEVNRQLISRVADLHFAPTRRAYENLISDKIDENRVYLTGNTIVDAINWGIKKIRKNSEVINQREPFVRIDENRKVILVTMHRRESFGSDMENICTALKNISQKYDDIQIIYPVHLNPNVKIPVYKKLDSIENIILTDPLDYESFIWLMFRSYLIITDSGGVQEEAPTLKKPVLVIRKKTERMESVESGISKLVGTGKDDLIGSISVLLNDKKEYEKMIPEHNPYGDGNAAEKILDHIYDYFY